MKKYLVIVVNDIFVDSVECFDALGKAKQYFNKLKKEFGVDVGDAEIEDESYFHIEDTFEGSITVELREVECK